MKLLLTLVSFGAVLLAGCSSSNLAYQPRTEPESREFQRDSLDVYPADVRNDPARFDGKAVAWAGIIRQSKAQDLDDGSIHLVTTFEHHYFDWQQNGGGHGAHFSLSPRGEGAFQTDWVLRKINPDAGATDAEQYAAPGKLAIVYGVTEGVNDNGEVKLKYRYLRVIDADKYTTGEFDYGRFGEPVVYLK
ncbi:MAG TPA: hypothetical protein VHB20_05670 [Verrucomicrobiae bacterium]|jgi:hypothetical protein|nr:hypothetical protein [Verrucomicrobiae bacterium]